MTDCSISAGALAGGPPGWSNPHTMRPSRHVAVQVDLTKVRANVEAILRRTGKPIIAVLKADAYGLGATAVATAVGDLVDGFYLFDLREAAEYRLHALTGKPTIVLLGDSSDPDDYRRLHTRPAVWTVERAAALRAAHPVLSVDTGQQRFGVAIDDGAACDAVIRAGACDEAFTHATTLAQALRFSERLAGRVARLHAAGSSLLDEPQAWLDAVRPGLALYRGAVGVQTPLVEVRDSTGPAGYTGFVTQRHGVIRAGYTNGIRPGPCRINGRPARVIEVGMQSAFVECAPGDRRGDQVVLLGDALSESDVARAWSVTPHEALARLSTCGERSFR